MNDIETYRNEDRSITGFKGNISMFGSKFFVDTKTGRGVDRVILSLEPLAEKYSRRVSLGGFDQEDIKQQVNLIILEGMRKFDASKEVMLSTFLFRHVYNRMALFIKQFNNVQKRDATFIKQFNEKDLQCPLCVGTLSKDDWHYKCGKCSNTFKNDVVEENTKAHNLMFSDDVIHNYNGTDNMHQYLHMIFPSRKYDVEFMTDFKEALEALDKDTRDILYMYIFEDKTLQDIGDELGITREWVRQKLSKLKQNKKLCNVLGRG